MTKMKRYKNLFLGLLLIFILSSCASTVPGVSDPEGPGFWSGILHGALASLAFIGSLFSDNIAIYAVNNTGGWYDFGFLIGLGSSVKGVGEILGEFVGGILKRLL